MTFRFYNIELKHIAALGVHVSEELFAVITNTFVGPPNLQAVHLRTVSFHDSLSLVTQHLRLDASEAVG